MFLPTGVITVTTATRSRRNMMGTNAIDSEGNSKRYGPEGDDVDSSVRFSWVALSSEARRA